MNLKHEWRRPSTCPHCGWYCESCRQCCCEVKWLNGLDRNVCPGPVPQGAAEAPKPETIAPPPPRPCESCPYRRDVASGVWAHEEYEKLRRYDRETHKQPTGVFQCHQGKDASGRMRVCAGWAGCHDGNHLLALRMGAMVGVLDMATVDAVIDYVSPVPLFASGSEAADHGQREIEHPDGAAVRTIIKIGRNRARGQEE